MPLDEATIARLTQLKNRTGPSVVKYRKPKPQLEQAYKNVYPPPVVFPNQYVTQSAVPAGNCQFEYCGGKTHLMVQGTPFCYTHAVWALARLLTEKDGDSYQD